MKDKNINFVFFFDELNAEIFKHSYKNLVKVYPRSHHSIYVGLNLKAYKILKNFLLENEIIYKIINSKFVEDKINPNTNITNFSFQRWHIYDYFPNLSLSGTTIYLDTDFFFIRKIDGKYLKKKNYAFLDYPLYRKKSLISWKKYWRNLLINVNEEILYKIEKLGDEKNYFNSGFLILNNHKLMQKLFYKCSESNIILNDQNIMNILNEGEISVEHNRYYNIAAKSLVWRHRRIQSIHFSGKPKPTEDDTTADKRIEKIIKDFNLID